MKHARKLDVVDKQSAPRCQPIVFTSRQRPANPAVAARACCDLRSLGLLSVHSLRSPQRGPHDVLIAGAHAQIA